MPQQEGEVQRQEREEALPPEEEVPVVLLGEEPELHDNSSGVATIVASFGDHHGALLGNCT